MTWILQDNCPDLASDAVHVWKAHLDPHGQDPQRLEAWATLLSSDEQERADRLVQPLDQQRFIVGRGILRHLLGRYLGQDPAALRFVYAARGKPSLASANPLGVRFNLAHSQGWGLYAITCQREVGVDLECHRSVKASALAKRFFQPSEALHIQQLPPADQPQTFFRLWTCKEAYVKATGEGLAALSHIELDPTDPPQVLRLGQDRDDLDRWRLSALPPIAGYSAALVVEQSQGSPPTLNTWHYRVRNLTTYPAPSSQLRDPRKTDLNLHDEPSGNPLEL